MASEKALSILEEIKSLTILEMNDLVKALEEEFGVTAAAPVAVAGAAGAPAEAAEENRQKTKLNSANVRNDFISNRPDPFDHWINSQKF